GRDTGGRGNAEADIVADAVALSPTSTKCTVTADLHITGKVAQFGRGIMGDVSKKLMDQFASNLNRMLDDQGAAPAAAEAQPDPPPDPAPPPEPAAAPSGGDGAQTTNTTASTTAGDAPPTIRKINGPAAEPVDLAGVAGPAVIKRVLPLVLALLVVVLI